MLVHHVWDGRSMCSEHVLLPKMALTRDQGVDGISEFCTFQSLCSVCLAHFVPQSNGRIDRRRRRPNGFVEGKPVSTWRHYLCWSSPCKIGQCWTNTMLHVVCNTTISCDFGDWAGNVPKHVVNHIPFVSPSSCGWTPCQLNALRRPVPTACNIFCWT